MIIIKYKQKGMEENMKNIFNILIVFNDLVVYFLLRQDVFTLLITVHLQLFQNITNFKDLKSTSQRF